DSVQRPLQTPVVGCPPVDATPEVLLWAAVFVWIHWSPHEQGERPL
ncbi:MAG: hypothetical protein K0S14_1638, partial [Thermomicrobiales bacterium]|nr:hypothetical protein [Thermomicrobiales bacterium]